MAPSHGFAAASHREAVLRGAPASHGETAFRGAAGFRDAHRRHAVHPSRNAVLRRRAGRPLSGREARRHAVRPLRNPAGRKRDITALNTQCAAVNTVDGPIKSSGASLATVDPRHLKFTDSAPRPFFRIETAARSLSADTRQQWNLHALLVACGLPGFQVGLASRRMRLMHREPAGYVRHPPHRRPHDGPKRGRERHSILHQLGYAEDRPGNRAWRGSYNAAV